MSYWTEFFGVLVVRPGLPSDFVNRWNSARRGTPDREYVRSFRYVASGITQIDAPDMLPGFAHDRKPQEWCHWKVVPATSGNRELVSLVMWDGSDNFLEYETWLQVFVDLIEREIGEHRWEGAIGWAGEETDDQGWLSIDRIGGRAVVSIELIED